jgi:chromate transporter
MTREPATRRVGRARDETPPHDLSFAEATRVWAKIGLLSFGGPAGQVALMHRELVERRKWIDEERFLHALNYCMLLPGPEAQQLATYIGWLMHRTRGGLVAGALFVLPGFVAILGLSLLYAGFRQLPAVAAVLFGLKAAVLAVVVEAVLRIGRRALRNRLMVIVAAAAFVGIFFFGVPFPLVVLTAGLFGLAGSRVLPEAFPAPAAARTDGAHDTIVDRLAARGGLAHTKPSRARAVRIALAGAALWGMPLLVLAALTGPDSVYVQEGVFFSKAAVVTFGGAYAVLAYIAQAAVETYGWLMPGEMIDGLGLAETTPGPLIMVVQFVAFMGAFRHPGALPPMLAGVVGSVVTVWVTFVPCFLWIFLGAPYIEALRGNRALHAALSTITAAVVGVVLNLSVWFGLHVLFRELTEQRIGALRLIVPDPASFDVAAGALTAFALVAVFRFHLGLPQTLAASAVLGALWKLLG